jgi:CelD/BcsL family acetyltransferase involved in cellulose biosynthesis
VQKSVHETFRDDLPVACTLGASDRHERVAAWHALGGDALTATAAAPDSFEARFDDTDEIRARIEHLLALERQCCAFLSFELERRDGAAILRITGPGAEHTGEALLGMRAA